MDHNWKQVSCLEKAVRISSVIRHETKSLQEVLIFWTVTFCIINIKKKWIYLETNKFTLNIQDAEKNHSRLDRHLDWFILS